MINVSKLFVVVFLFYAGCAWSQSESKKRVLVLTDMEADPDDAQSLIRFLTYSNKWDVEGLIATTSIHQKQRIAPETIHKILSLYDQVLPNLLLHESGFPTAAFLKSKVKKGLALYGMQGVGKEHDSEGSEWIINLLQSPDPRPLWISVWGGPNCLAQALWKIKETKSAAEAEKLYRKIRIYTISDQDDSGPWIRKTFPSIFFVCSPGYTYGKATWVGIARPFPGSDKEVVSNEWLAQHIQQGHGPMGAAYPDVAYGMEGDTPAFLSLIPNGLNDPEHPNFGGWGGRYELYTPQLPKTPEPGYAPGWPVTEQETRPLWTNAEDSVISAQDQSSYKSIHATIWRWRTAFQNDFAARMDWGTKSFKECNHPPIPGLINPEVITVKSGEQFRLNGNASVDPDGDSMSYLWFQYPEAGTYKGMISFRPYAANLVDLPITAPTVSSPQTVHFILKVTDKGTPALTRYKRVIVTFVPK